jgi:hypothetical protein
MLRPFQTGLVAIVVFWGSLVVFMVVTQIVAASIAPSIAREEASCPGSGFEPVACMLDGVRAPDQNPDTSGCRR